jgi:hypothetical protein
MAQQKSESTFKQKLSESLQMPFLTFSADKISKYFQANTPKSQGEEAID